MIDPLELRTMPAPKLILLILLGLFTLFFVVTWGQSLRRKWKEGLLPTPYQLLIGFVTDFLDTLGVGSFATTTTLFRMRRVVEDVKIPGTLNVGHTLPTILQAFIYIQAIEIDLWTLWLLILSSVVGSYLGASVVSRLPKHLVQLGMATAMLIAVALLTTSLLKLMPIGGDDLGLRGGKLGIGMAANFIFGAMMTIGVGAYAPIMVLVSLLGMNPKASFPLMMGSCAFLMPVASYRFVKSDAYDARAALGLTLLGIPAVAIAAFLVKSLPLDYVKWLVVFVVLYTSLSMFYSAFKASDKG